MPLSRPLDHVPLVSGDNGNNGSILISIMWLVQLVLKVSFPPVGLQVVLHLSVLH